MGHTDRRRRAAGPQGPGAFLETLEPRLFLSGTVTAVLCDGVLKIAGDAQANQLVVDQAGLAAGQVRVSGTGDTLVKVGKQVSASAVFEGVKAVVFDLRAGDDSVSLNGVTLSGGVVFDGGKGRNSFEVFFGSVGGDVLVCGGQELSLFHAAVGGSLIAAACSGDTMTTIWNTTFGGSVNLMLGAGSDMVWINQTTTGGSMKVHTGDGGSTVTLNDVTVGREGRAPASLFLDGGKGDDMFSLFGATVSGDLAVRTGAGTNTTAMACVQVQGDFRLHGRGAREAVSLWVVEVRGRTMVQTGKGNDLVVIDDSTFHQAFALSTGAGQDSVEIEANGDPAGPVTTFGGPALVRLGADDDTLQIGVEGQAGNSAAFQGPAVFRGGRGADVLLLPEGLNQFAVPPTIRGF